MVLARNSDYRGRFRGNLQQLELSILEDPSAILEMYEADCLDILDLIELPPQERDRARRRHAGDYVSSPMLSTAYVAFDVSRPPFDDLRVRRAFALATDRETLADVILRGYDAPATGGFVPPGMPGHSPGIGLPYDPDRARKLLAAAGYPAGHDFPAVDSLTFSGAAPLVKHLQAQWRENLGIEIIWETTAFGLFLDRLRAEPPHAFVLGWSADYPDPDNFLRVAVRDIRRSNRWRNEAYGRLVKEARRVMDQGARMELYRQADRILVEEAGTVPLIYRQFHLLVNETSEYGNYLQMPFQLQHQ